MNQATKIWAPLLRQVPSLLAFILLSSVSHADIVADFEEDFQSRGTAAGWAYLWNSTGVALGDHDQYTSLLAGRGGRFFPNPESLPSKANPSPTENAKWLFLGRGIMAPGDGPLRSTDGLPHYAIAAYTIQPGEAGQGSIRNSWIQRKAARDQGRISIYVNERLIGEDVVLANEASTFDVPLGPLRVGDVVYVAFGPGEKSPVTAFVKFQIDTQ